MKYTFRNVLFSWLLTAGTLLVCRPCSARDIVLNEGFESGIPSTWTQEYVSGHQSWTVEQAPFAYPDDSFRGKGRVALRNPSNQTLHYISRLVSPAMDLRTAHRPVLSFAYALPRWSGDNDTLRVLCRPSEDKPWTLISEYTEGTNRWVSVKLNLVGYAYPSYQIAFEGIDGLGRGIVVDSVLIRPYSECSVPTHLSTSDMMGDSLTIAWHGSYDSDYSRLVLSTRSLNPEETDLAICPDIVLDTLIESDYMSCRLRLTQGMRYFCYMQSVCERERSDWSSEFAFLMKASAYIPFYEDFNTPFTKGEVTRLQEWFWMGSGNQAPFIASNLNAAECTRIGLDGSFPLVFADGDTASLIPGGHLSYCVTPELIGADLKDCSVNLQAGVYTYCGRNYARSLIVGVMTNPDDIATFTPVDTLRIWHYRGVYRYSVSLASYTGRGRYVALVSRFDKPNLFFVDNLSVTLSESPSSASSHTVVPFDSVSSFTGADLSSSRLMPMVYDMEPAGSNCITVDDAVYPAHMGLYSNAGTYPCISDRKAHNSSNALLCVKPRYKDMWLALPKMEDIRHSQVAFYFAGNTSTGEQIYNSQGMFKDWIAYDSRIAVGVMSDPSDISTFDTVATFTNRSEQFTRHFVHFADYQGDGRYIAILWDDPQNGSTATMCYIDDITVSVLDDCLPPAWTALNGEADEGLLSWSAIGAPCQLVVSSEPLSDEQLLSGGNMRSIYSVILDTLLSDNQLRLTGLSWSSSYYCYARTVCASGRSEWSQCGILTTHCPDAVALPYFENFDRPIQSTCWYSPFGLTDFNQFVHSGTTSLLIDIFDKAPDYYFPAGVIAPKLDVSLPNLIVTGYALRTDVSSLYHPKTGYWTDLVVGVVPQSNSLENFFAVDTITIYKEIIPGTPEQEWVPFRIDFSSYTGPDGYVAFVLPVGTTLTWYMLDDLTFIDNSIACSQVRDIHTTEQMDDALRLTWMGKSSDGWHVRLLDGADSSVVVMDTMVTNADLLVSGLQLDTKYYASVSPMCNSAFAAVDSVFTACARIDLNNGTYYEGFESYPSSTKYSPSFVPRCWHTGTVQEDEDIRYPYIAYSEDGLSAHIGTNSFSLLSARQPVWIASPELICDDLSALIVDFYHNCRRGESFIVGVMSDPDDISTFVALDSISGTGSMTLASVNMGYYANRLTPDTRYLAFRTTYMHSTSLFIDDISIHMERCHAPAPVVSNLTADGFHLSSGLRNMVDWRAVVVNRRLPADSLHLPGYHIPSSVDVACDSLVTDVRAIDISGLSAQRTYYVYTSALCDTAFSSWQILTVTTPCDERTPAELGTIGFETAEGYTAGIGIDLPCWTTGNQSDGEGQYIPYVDNDAARAHAGSGSLRLISSDTNNGAYAVLPPLDVEDIRDWDITFYGYASLNNNKFMSQLYVGVITDPGDLSSLVVMDTIQGQPGVMGGYRVSFSSYEGDFLGNIGKTVAFLLNVSHSASDWSIDDISFSPHSSCPVPSYVRADSVGADYALLRWNGSSERYRVMLAKTEVPAELRSTYPYTIDTIVATDSVRIRMLDSQTDYFAYVQSFCGDTSISDFSVSFARFTTPKPKPQQPTLTLPYKNDFNKERAGYSQHPKGWTTSYIIDNELYPYIQTNTGVDHSNALLFYSHDDIRCAACTPALQVDDWLQCEVSFDMALHRANAVNVLVVGLVTDTLDIYGSFIPVDTLSPTTTAFMPYTVPFAGVDTALAAKAQGVGFICDCKIKQLDYLYALIDNLVVHRHPTCFTPSFTIDSVGVNELSVRVSPAYPEDTRFQLAVIAEQIAVQLDDESETLSASRMVEFDNTHFVVDSLEEGTIYRLYLRTLCSETDFSEWTVFQTVRTRYRYTDGWCFGFERTEPFQKSEGASSDTYYIHPALRVGVRNTIGASYLSGTHSLVNTAYATYARNGAGALCLPGTVSGQGGAYVIFPAIDSCYQPHNFSFNARVGYLTPSTGMISSTGKDAHLVVGLVRKNTGMDSFEPLADLVMPDITGQVATPANNYLFGKYILRLMPEQLKDYQVALWYQPTVSATVYIDDACLSAADDWATPLITSVSPSSNSIALSWLNQGGPWNLHIVNGADTLHISGLTDDSCLVTNLMPQTEYKVILMCAAHPSELAVSSCTRTVTTLCPSLSDTYYEFTFDSDYEPLVSSTDEYQKPTCWTMGSTDLQKRYFTYWQIAQSSYNLICGINNSNALYVSSGDFSFNNMTPFAVMPPMEFDPDTMMLSFYFRPFAHRSNGRINIFPDTLLYSRDLIVGTVSNPDDLNTFIPLAEIDYPYDNLSRATVMGEDPAGMDYWYPAQISLKGIGNRYITFIQAGPGTIYIDSVVVASSRGYIFMPYGLKADCQTHSATLSWETGNSTYPSVVSVMQIISGDTSLVYKDTVSGTSCFVERLQPATDYFFSVRQIDGVRSGRSSALVRFTTGCYPYSPAEYFHGFEEDGTTLTVPGADKDDYRQTRCWTYGDASGLAWTKSFPYNMPNSTTATVAYEGNCAVRLYAEYNAYYGLYQTYMAMPQIEDVSAYDTLQFNFMMRPADINPTTGKVNNNYTFRSGNPDSYYAKAVIVGTCDNPSDPATFRPIDTVTYTLEGGILTSDHVAAEANNYLFQKVSVPLRGATGSHIYIMSTLYAKGTDIRSSFDYMYIDNVSLTLLHDCLTPTDLAVRDISSTSARVSWQAASSATGFVVEVSPSSAFETTLERDTVSARECLLTRLMPASACFVRVRSLCSQMDDESAWSDFLAFHTARQPFFYEDFRNHALADDWSGSNTLSADIFNRNQPLSGRNSEKTGWRLVTMSDGDIAGSHYAAPLWPEVASPKCNWLVTPALNLDAAMTAHLTLEVALAALNSDSSFSAAPVQQVSPDYAFIVAISDDGGLTWQRGNASVWTDGSNYGTEVTPLSGLSSRFSSIDIDLARYAGRTIKIALGCESSTSRPDLPGSAVHIGSLRINYYQLLSRSYTLCQYEDIDAFGWQISGDNTLPGYTLYERSVLATEPQALRHISDSLYRIEATYLATPVTRVSDSDCAGHDYTRYGFLSNTLTQSGTYKRKLISAVTGCDSIVVLDLALTPAVYSSDSVTLHQGESMPWHNLTLNRPGVYFDTLQSAVTGCDSICSLVLSFTDESRLDHTTADYPNVHKVLLDGRLYIICDDHWFNAMGQAVKPKEEK